MIKKKKGNIVLSQCPLHDIGEFKVAQIIFKMCKLTKICACFIENFIGTLLKILANMLKSSLISS